MRTPATYTLSDVADEVEFLSQDGWRPGLTTLHNRAHELFDGSNEVVRHHNRRGVQFKLSEAQADLLAEQVLTRHAQPGENRTSWNDVALAGAMRSSGHYIREIAEELGCSKACAQRKIQRAYDRGYPR